MFGGMVYVSSSCLFFFFKQKTAYEMRISDWSSDVCSSDLGIARRYAREGAKVVIAELNQTNGEAVADEIGRDFGGSAICIPTDVRDRAQLLGMIDETVRRFGKIGRAHV